MRLQPTVPPFLNTVQGWRVKKLRRCHAGAAVLMWALQPDVQ